MVRPSRADLLILDEPSSGLDPIVRRDILEAIIRTVTDEGRTVIFSSHLLDEVERVSDHVAMLLFLRIADQQTFNPILTIYSFILGVFIPSGGGLWVVEAPYVMEAAKALNMHLGWTVQTYNAAETLPNLLNPFFMLPLMGILNVRACARPRRLLDPATPVSYAAGAGLLLDCGADVVGAKRTASTRGASP